MRWIILAAALVMATPVEAHCYSHWYYPQPQRCAAARQMVRLIRLIPNQEARPVPLVHGREPDIPLPSLAQADLVGGEADEPTRAKILLRAALEAASDH